MMTLRQHWLSMALKTLVPALVISLYGFILADGTRLVAPTVLIGILIILAGLHYYKQLPRYLRYLYIGFMLVVLFVMGFRMVDSALWSMETGYGKDFWGFWASARVAIQGENFYDGDNLRLAVEHLPPDNATEYFMDRLIDPGFWYPPISILVLLPLGLFELHTAWILSYIVLLAILLIVAWLTWRSFLPETGWEGLGAVLAITLLIFPTKIVILESQTNFHIALLLLLYWRYRQRHWSGIWLALAITFKPVIGGVVLFLLLRKHWRTLGSLVLTLAALALVVLVLYGPQIFLDYAPTNRIPRNAYSEDINQSLLGTLLRLSNFDIETQHPMSYPPFWIAAGILTAITAWIGFRVPKDKGGWVFAMTLTLGLFLYPASLRHYGTFLLFPIFFIWSERKETIGPFAVLVMTGSCMLVTWQYGFTTFLGFLFTWFFTGMMGLYLAYGQGWPLHRLQDRLAAIRPGASRSEVLPLAPETSDPTQT